MAEGRPRPLMLRETGPRGHAGGQEAQLLGPALAQSGCRPDQSHHLPGPQSPHLSLGCCGFSLQRHIHREVKCMGSGTRILGSDPGCVTLGKSLRLSGPQFPHLGTGAVSTSSSVDRAGSFNGFILTSPFPPPTILQHANRFLSGTDSRPLSLLPQKDQPPPGKNNFWFQFLFSRRERGVEAALGAGR